MSSRWLVTGAGGMLGRDLVAALRTRPGVRVTAADRAALDITDPAAVARAVPGHDVVVNTAAWTDVDGAEAAEDRATAVNGHAVGHLARVCVDTGARLVQLSTDYVLAGAASTPYPEDAPTAPVNAYGRGKLIGERAVATYLPDQGYVLRTAWLYGQHGANFVATMLRLAATRPSVAVVDDQHGQPTATAALAPQIADLGAAALAGTAPAGVYHGTAAGHTTWHGLARAVYQLVGLDPERVLATSSDRFPRPARRPAFSVLDHRRWAAAGLTTQPHWHDQLTGALRQPGFAALAEAARAAAPTLTGS